VKPHAQHTEAMRDMKAESLNPICFNSMIAYNTLEETGPSAPPPSYGAPSYVQPYSNMQSYPQTQSFSQMQPGYPVGPAYQTVQLPPHLATTSVTVGGRESGRECCCCCCTCPFWVCCLMIVLVSSTNISTSELTAFLS